MPGPSLLPGRQVWAESRQFPTPVGQWLVLALPACRSPWLGHAHGPGPAHATICPAPSAPRSSVLKSHLLSLSSSHFTPVWISPVFMSYPVPILYPPWWVDILQVGSPAVSVTLWPLVAPAVCCPCRVWSLLPGSSQGVRDHPTPLGPQ